MSWSVILHTLAWSFTICVAYPLGAMAVYLVLVKLTVSISAARITLSVRYTVQSCRHPESHHSQNQLCVSKLKTTSLHT